MIRRCTQFDPATGNMNTPLYFTNTLPDQVGYLIIFNDSMINLIFTFGDSQQTIVAGTVDLLTITQATSQIGWQQDFVFPNYVQAPSSRVIVDCADWSEEFVFAKKTYPLALPRVSNVGNAITTAVAASSVVNDGNGAGTIVVEATPAAASSELKLLNDGTGYLGNGNLLIGATKVTAAGGYTIDAAMLSGTLASGVAVPAAAIAAGALASGVTSPNYLPLTGGTVTGQLTLNKAMSGGDVILAQLAASDQSVAARWTIVNRNSDSALEIIDQTNGNTPVILTPTAGQSTFAGTLNPRFGNGTFSMRGNFSGTGSGTFATGAGTTPNWVGITDSQAGSSMTVGVVISGTNAVVTAGASHTWSGVAI